MSAAVVLESLIVICSRFLLVVDCLCLLCCVAVLYRLFMSAVGFVLMLLLLV